MNRQFYYTAGNKKAFSLSYYRLNIFLGRSWEQDGEHFPAIIRSYLGKNWPYNFKETERGRYKTV